MRILEALGDYFVDLSEGDPVAWAFTAIPIAFAALIGILAWRARAEQRRWEERKGKKPGAREKK